MANLTGASVFVVEDEPIVAFDLRVTLEEAGAMVIGPALTLQQAEELAAKAEISVALLDVRIGSDDVFPIAAKLSDRGIPLIFHTGHATADALLAQWPGAKLLPKPTRTDVLLATIKGLWRRKNPVDRAAEKPGTKNGV